MANQGPVTLKELYYFKSSGTWETYPGPSFGVGKYGYVGGGGDPSTTIEKIIFATDTASATNKGNLLNSGANTRATTNYAQYAWWAGGSITNTNRLVYSTDTADTTNRGPLSTVRIDPGSMSMGPSGQAGYYTCGNPSVPAQLSNFDKITFATDTATSVLTGKHTATVRLNASIGITTDGWTAGGSGGTPTVYYSLVSRLIFATDTATGSAKGLLSTARFGMATITDNTNVYWCGGNPSAGIISTVERLNISQDSTASVAKGPLNFTGQQMCSVYQKTSFGIINSYPSPGLTTCKLTFFTDTVQAVASGTLNASHSMGGANSSST